MIPHLLLITLGPVQEFIAQARRTRDLWYGSHMLSELARAAARTLVEGGAQLVFPALERGDPELEPCAAPLRPNNQAPLNIPNKLLAIVPEGSDPGALAREVRHQVFEHWRHEIVAPIKEKCKGLLAPGTEEIWAEQSDTLLEFLASWAPLRDYGESRRAVERAIAGRKNLRDFRPWRHARGAVPKSSLDGARETVLREPEQREPGLVRKYRIENGEQLDAVALIKRAGGEPDQFVPVANIALACWVKLAASAAAAELERLRQACQRTGISRVVRPDLPCAAPFAFDAGMLLRSRWQAIFKEQRINEKEDPQAWGRAYVEPLLRKMSDPYPYVACLVADGDHMGRALDSLANADDHRALSGALSDFAGQARYIAEQHHRGALIYSGGDDVLAFLPLPEAVACAGDLRQAFEERVASACSRLPQEVRPTLSVGVGIGHVMEGLGDLLALGREAEGEAKRKRNCLAVLVEMRSGGRLCWSASWNEQPAECLQRSVGHLDTLLPARKVYEIATILRRLPGGSAEARWAAVLTREVERVLSRVGEGSVTPGQVDLDLNDHADYEHLRSRISTWLNRVLIARVLARSQPRQRRQGEEVMV
jgi:CRISPR-associated protein Cmr2